MALRLVAGLFLALLTTSVPASEPATAPAAPATAAPATTAPRVSEIADVEQYLRHIRDVVALANQGEYGKLKPAELESVEDAQRDIELVFGNRKGGITLTDDEQGRLAKAQETINAVLHDGDKSRIVCSSIQATGGPLSKRECLSVGAREERVRIAREKVQAMQGNSR